jgi:soluble lytic murein transglycosylase-like protein
MIRGLIISIFLILAPTASWADMLYRHVDGNGRIHYSNVPYSNYQETKTVSKKTMSRNFYTNNYGVIIKSKAMKYSVDPSLIEAVIKVESSFNARAVSRKGALGLMQLMPSTATAMGVRNPFSPEQNIEGGTKYLRYLLERFDGNLKLVLAAYNSGPTRVEKYGAIPPIMETRRYVKKIFKLYNGNGQLLKVVGQGNGILRIVMKDGTVLYTDTGLNQ